MNVEFDEKQPDDFDDADTHGIVEDSLDHGNVLGTSKICFGGNLDELDQNDVTTSSSTPHGSSEDDLDCMVQDEDGVPCAIAPRESLHAEAPPPGCSEEELDRRLHGIRWRLEFACECRLRNQEEEIPLLVESIRVTTGWLVWAERYISGASFVDVFRKHTIFEAFALVLRTKDCPRSITIQVMQSISILMPSLKHVTSVDYLLRHLNPFFEDPPDLEDEEVLAYFVTILRSLSCQLNVTNVRYCILDADGNSMYQLMNGTDGGGCTSSSVTLHMPVLTCAVNLLNHEESMAQTAIKTAILKVLQLEHRAVRMICKDCLNKILVPKLSMMIDDQRRRGKQKCKWMWGDCFTGKISEKNPLRWSQQRCILETIGDIRRESRDRPHRPVLVRYVSDRVRRRYNSPSDAISALEEVLEISISGFVRDLFQLGIPIVTEALQSQGFAVSTSLDATLFLP